MQGAREFGATRQALNRASDDENRRRVVAELSDGCSLLGRDADIARLRALLSSTEHPVIAVVGEPGIGKTAVIGCAINGLTTPSVAVRHVDAQQWRGTSFAELRAHISGLRTPSHVRPFVVISRADSLMTAYDELTTLARSTAPITFVLESSGESARCWAQNSIHLGPLSDADASALFRRSARSIGITLPDDNRTAALVRQICDAVDGNPLGILLAAARTRILPMNELASLLNSPSGAVAVLSSFTWRQRDGSLTDPELAEVLPAREPTDELLEALSVFSGSFTLRAVAAVAGDLLSFPYDAVTELIDARLLQVVGDDENRRFRLSRLVRAHAAVRLAESGGEKRARDRHALYFSHQARRAARATEDADDHSARAILGDDIDEMWEALRYLIDQEPVTALQLASDLSWDAQGRGTAQGLAAVLEQLVANCPDAEPSIRRDALLSLTELQSWIPDASDRARVIRRRLHEAMTLARSSNEPLPLLRALHARYLAVTTDGDLAGAVDACTEGMALAAEVGHVRWLSRFEVALSAMWAFIEQWDTAIPLALSGLSRALRSEDKRTVVHASVVLHSAPPEHVNNGSTIPELEAVLDIASEIGDATNESHVLAALAYRAIESGDHEEAIRWVHTRHERLGRAELLHGLTVSTMLAALAAHLRGDAHVAARLHAAIAPSLEALMTVLPPRNAQRYSEMLREVREELGPTAFDATMSRGKLQGRNFAREELAAFLDSAHRAQNSSPDGAAASAQLVVLSPREQEVLRALARGLRNKEIASELHITPKTVMHHTVSIYRKLGVRSRAEAATHPAAREAMDATDAAAKLT